jgi:hypothetical protein
MRLWNLYILVEKCLLGIVRQCTRMYVVVIGHVHDMKQKMRNHGCLRLIDHGLLI